MPDGDDPNSRGKEFARHEPGPGAAKRAGRPRKGREKVQIEARRVRVEHLELSGWSIRAIAVDVGVSVGTVQHDLKRIRAARSEAIGATTLEDRRLIELDRLEAQYREVSTVAKGLVGEAGPTSIGDFVKLEHTLLAIHDRVVRLLGLAAPVRVEAEVSVTTLYEKLSAYLQDIREQDDAEALDDDEAA
jgi:hypothetical protein